MTHESSEEEDDVHDGEGETSLEHSACLVDVKRPVTTALTAVVAKGTQAEVDGSSLELGAVLIRDGTQLVDRRNQRPHEGKIYQCNEQGRMTSPQIGHKRCKSPRCRQDRCDEEQQDVCWRKLIVDDKAVDEPRQHAHDGDQSEYLRNAEREEEEA